jgi:hypothetical protein
MVSNTMNGKDFIISPRSVDSPRPLKIAVVGAGISGILAAIEFQKRVQNLELTIYEKNSELGGTWWENKYPGCACGKLSTIPKAEDDLADRTSAQTYLHTAISCHMNPMSLGVNFTLEVTRFWITGSELLRNMMYASI